MQFASCHVRPGGGRALDSGVMQVELRPGSPSALLMDDLV